MKIIAQFYCVSGFSCACSDKKPLEIDPRMNVISCPDGRELLMIMKTTKKDAGLYECVATNALASVSSSCKLSLAREYMQRKTYVHTLCTWWDNQRSCPGLRRVEYSIVGLCIIYNSPYKLIFPLLCKMVWS